MAHSALWQVTTGPWSPNKHVRFKLAQLCFRMMTRLHCKFGPVFQKLHMTVITSGGFQLSVESNQASITLVLVLGLLSFEIS